MKFNTFTFSLGSGLKKLKQEIDDYLFALNTYKENKIQVSKSAPEYSEEGDLWIDITGDKIGPFLEMKEIEVDCRLGSTSINDIPGGDDRTSINVVAYIFGQTTFHDTFKIEQSPDKLWYGYLQGNYGECNQDFFGTLNWFACNKDTKEVWFEALGYDTSKIGKVIVIFPENSNLPDVELDGRKDGLGHGDLFFNDYVIDDKITEYIISNEGKIIDIMFKVYPK